MMGILYDVLVTPVSGLTRATQERPVGWALLVAVIACAIAVVAIILNPREGFSSMGRQPGLLASLAFVLPAGACGMLIVLAVGAGFTHLAAILLGGRGSYVGMICGLCFATFPLAFFAPLALLHAIPGVAGSFLYYTGFVGLLLWIIVLQVFAIRQNYSFSTARAVGAYFIQGMLGTLLLMLALIPVMQVVMSLTTLLTWS